MRVCPLLWDVFGVTPSFCRRPAWATPFSSRLLAERFFSLSESVPCCVSVLRGLFRAASYTLILTISFFPSFARPPVLRPLYATHRVIVVSPSWAEAFPEVFSLSALLSLRCISSRFCFPALFASPSLKHRFPLFLYQLLSDGGCPAGLLSVLCAFGYALCFRPLDSFSPASARIGRVVCLSSARCPFN